MFAPAVILPAPFSVQEIVPLADVAPDTVWVVFTHTSASDPASAVGEAVTVTNLVSTAAVQLPLLTVRVSVTTVPASAPTGVYVGVNVVPPDSVPAPLDVH